MYSQQCLKDIVTVNGFLHPQNTSSFIASPVEAPCKQSPPSFLIPAASICSSKTLQKSTTPVHPHLAQHQISQR